MNASDATLTKTQIAENLKEMQEYFRNYGFTNLCYISGDGSVACRSNNAGVFVKIDAANCTFELSVIDGMIDCRINNLGYPNKHLPVFIENLQRHIFN